MTLFKNVIQHIPNHFDFPAFSCSQAAMHRNILFHQELKTIIFEKNGEIYAVHLPGDKKVNKSEIPALKKDSKLLGENLLKKYGLQKGIVNPFNIKTNLPLKMVYICNSLFYLDKIYTNDGTQFGTIILAPHVLITLHENSQTGYFSKSFTKVHCGKNEL